MNLDFTKLDKDTRIKQEVKVGVAGTVDWEVSSDYLENIDSTFKNHLILAKGSHGKGDKPLELGYKVDTDTLKVCSWFTMQKENVKQTLVVNYQLDPAWQAGFKLSRPLAEFKNTEVEGGFAHYVPNTPHIWAMNAKAAMKDDEWKCKSAAWYFKTSTANGALGTKVEWDNEKSKGSAEAGLQLNMDGYKWMFRAASDGLLRMAVQTQLHKQCKATLNTNMKVSEFLDGKVTKLPVGLSCEFKY